MSFLYSTTPILRTSVARQSSRMFSTAVVYRKSVTDAVKEPLKKVDRAVSDKLVAGIEKGIEVKEKAASVTGIEANKASGKASEVAGEAKGKAAELKGEAKGKAEEVKQQM